MAPDTAAGRFDLSGDGMAVLAFHEGRLVAALAEGLTEFTCNGAAVSHEPLSPGPQVRRKEWRLPAIPLATSLIRD